MWTGFGVVGMASVASYMVPTIWHKVTHTVQNFKTKYDAKWALVTGGSSGIGLAIANRLASQGINVVIAAFPDSTFDRTFDELVKKYPSIQFRKIKVNLGVPGFLPELIEQTKDLEINIVFNNAGYIKTGFFTRVTLQDQMQNFHCNATAAVEITHHFLDQMLKKKLKGCFGFTSSPAGFTPTPTSIIYGSTKSFLTEFAASLAPEVRGDGIDVCVVHPSPVASRFYEGTHKLGAIEFFKSTATGPETIAKCFFQSMGRTVIRDQGYYPSMMKIILKLVDYNLFTDLITRTSQYLGEFANLKKAGAPEPRKV